MLWDRAGQAEVMAQSSTTVLVIKQLSSKWGKMDCEWVFAGLNEVIRIGLAQTKSLHENEI